MTRRELEILLNNNHVRKDDNILLSVTCEGGWNTEIYETSDCIHDYGWEDDGRGGIYFYIDIEN